MDLVGAPSDPTDAQPDPGSGPSPERPDRPSPGDRGAVTEVQVNGALREGRWTRVLPGVYCTDPAGLGPIEFIRAVHLWAGPDSVIEGASALIWQRRSDRSLTPVTVSAGRNLRPPTAAWPIIARRHRIPEFWRVRWNDILTVRTEYAVAQLLPAQGPALLDEAVRRRWVTVDMVAQAHESLSPGRGSALRARIISAAQGGAISEGERLLHRHLRAAGIRGWRANAPVRLGTANRTGDVVFDEIKLLVEVDGFAFHSNHERFQDDRVRQNEFAAAGWTVLRFTWWSLTDTPERVVRDIRTTIDRLQAGRDPHQQP